MDERLAAFVRYVEAHQGVSSSKVAEHFGVSGRSVRNWLARANKELADIAVISSENGLYALSVTDEAAYARLLGGGDAPWEADPATSEQRVEAMLMDLLFRPGWVTLDEYEQTYYVTRRTLSTEMREVEAALARYDLSIERRPHYGIRVAGSEMNRRLCLARMAQGHTDKNGAVGAHTYSTSVSDAFGINVGHLVSWIDEVVATHDIALTGVAYQALVLHLSIALARLAAGGIVPMEPKQLATIKASSEYAYARDLARLVERDAGLTMPEEEVAYAAIHFASKRTLDEVTASPAGGSAMYDEVQRVVLEMLDEVGKAYHIDLFSDAGLRHNLYTHVVPLAMRLRYRMDLKNPLLDEVRNSYPYAFSMARAAGVVLERHYGTLPSEDEMGYLALLFALALERRRTDLGKRRVLVVTSNGPASARLLEHQWAREFGDLAESVRGVDASRLGSVDYSQVDCAFTTTKLSRELPVPTYEAPFVLNEAEAARVRLILRDAEPTTSEMGGFSAERFYAHLPFATKRELLGFLCERAEASGFVDEGFTGLVWEREAAIATTFGDLTAVPHPSQACSDETYLWVGLTDQDGPWAETGVPVRAVFLVSYARGMEGQMDALIDSLASISVDAGAVARLLNEQTWDCLARMLA